MYWPQTPVQDANVHNFHWRAIPPSMSMITYKCLILIQTCILPEWFFSLCDTHKFVQRSFLHFTLSSFPVSPCPKLKTYEQDRFWKQLLNIIFLLSTWRIAQLFQNVLWYPGKVSVQEWTLGCQEKARASWKGCHHITGGRHPSRGETQCSRERGEKHFKAFHLSFLNSDIHNKLW